MSLNRRGFLGALIAAAASPAIVRADSLMKLAPPPRLWGDGIHDDADALSYWLSRPGFHLASGVFLISKAVRVHGATDLLVERVKLIACHGYSEQLMLEFSGTVRNATIAELYLDNSNIPFGAGPILSTLGADPSPAGHTSKEAP